MKKIVIFLILLLSFSLVGCDKQEKVYIEDLGITNILYNKIIKTLDNNNYQYIHIEEYDAIMDIDQFEDIYCFILNIDLNYEIEEYDCYALFDDIILKVRNINWERLVYYKNKIYNFEEAYKKGIITKEIVASLHKKDFHQVGYDEISFKYPTCQTKYNISKEYYHKYGVEISDENLMRNCVKLNNYTSYDEKYVFLAILIGEINLNEYVYEKVNNYYFRTYQGYKLIIYSIDKNFYSLQEAYDKRIINEDVEKLYEMNEHFCNSMQLEGH